MEVGVMPEVLRGLLGSPVNLILLAVGVLALAAIALPKELIGKLVGRAKAVLTAPTPGAEASDQVGESLSVTVPTRAGKLVECLAQIKEIERELLAQGLPSASIPALREEIIKALGECLRQEGDGVQ